MHTGNPHPRKIQLCRFDIAAQRLCKYITTHRERHRQSNQYAKMSDVISGCEMSTSKRVCEHPSVGDVRRRGGAASLCVPICSSYKRTAQLYILFYTANTRDRALLVHFHWPRGYIRYSTTNNWAIQLDGIDLISILYIWYMSNGFCVCSGVRVHHDKEIR